MRWEGNPAILPDDTPKAYAQKPFGNLLVTSGRGQSKDVAFDHWVGRGSGPLAMDSQAKWKLNKK